MTDATQSIGILQFALDSIVEQQQTIANNIANEDTPGYQADQVTFAVLAVQCAGQRRGGDRPVRPGGPQFGDQRQQCVASH